MSKSGLDIVAEEGELMIQRSEQTEEVLLPPLPTNSQESGHRFSSVSISSNGEVPAMVEEDFLTNFSKNMKHYDFDNISMDELFKERPSQVSTSTAVSNVPETPNNNNTSSGSTSPLKKLKSLKRGFRKLSLSLSISSTNKDISAEQDSSSSSDSNMDSCSAKISCTKSSTQTSVDYASLTPLIASPVITLSENLPSSKKNIKELEERYFESVHNLDYTRVKSISDLISLEDLMGYSEFLNKSKAEVIDAYTITKNRLIDCGWFSREDLDNLQFQLDSTLAQIDRKVSEIEKRLNIEFGASIYNSDSYSVNHETGVSYPLKVFGSS